MYVPPEGSKYTSVEAFDEIENKLQIVNDNDTLCALVGDFNARSFDLNHFIIPHDYLWSFLNYNTDDGISAELYDFQNLFPMGSL